MKRIFNKETHDWDVVPSEGYGPNKYLISDADSNPRWEIFGKYQMVFQYVSGGYKLVTHTFAQVNDMFNHNSNLMSAVRVVTPSKGAEAHIIVSSSVEIRRIFNMNTFETCYWFTFIDEDGNLLRLQLNPDDTVTEAVE